MKCTVHTKSNANTWKSVKNPNLPISTGALGASLEGKSTPYGKKVSKEKRVQQQTSPPLSLPCPTSFFTQVNTGLSANKFFIYTRRANSQKAKLKREKRLHACSSIYGTFTGSYRSLKPVTSIFRYIDICNFPIHIA